MIMAILSNTPVWVWALLSFLLVLGLNQARTRTVGRTRIVIVPLLLKAFSLYGTVTNFGGSPVAITVWALAAASAIMLTWNVPVHAETRFNPETNSFHLPGSWLPMAVITGIFCIKYTTGVVQAIQHPIGDNLAFTVAMSLLTGVLSGLLSSRGMRLVRFSMTQASKHSARASRVAKAAVAA